MRIIQFSDSFLPIMDGVGNVVYQYALNLGLRGHESYVVAPQTDTGYRGNFPFEIVDYVGLPLLKLKSYTVGAPALDAHCRKRLSDIEADIVHIHSPFTAGQAGLLYAQKRGCPIVGTFHSKYYDDFLQVTGVELLAEVGVKYVVSCYNRCDEVWAVSAASADTLRGYGYEGDIRVMPNGTDIHPLDEAVARAAWKRFGLADVDVPVLLYVGQINWKKNLRHILEGCAQLKRPFRLVMAGQGPHEKEVRELAVTLGIGSRVQFTGHLQDTDILNALYRRADLFLLPSLYDTSSLVVREAAAMGTPAVVTRGSCAAEGISDGENGFLCQDDPGDLARTVEEALSDPERLARVGERARDTIPIPWARLMDGVLDIYGQLIQTRKHIDEQ